MISTSCARSKFRSVWQILIPWHSTVHQTLIRPDFGGVPRSKARVTPRVQIQTTIRVLADQWDCCRHVVNGHWPRTNPALDKVRRHDVSFCSLYVGAVSPPLSGSLKARLFRAPQWAERGADTALQIGPSGAGGGLADSLGGDYSKGIATSAKLPGEEALTVSRITSRCLRTKRHGD